MDLREKLKKEIATHVWEPFTKYGIPCFDEFDSPTAPYIRCTACGYEQHDYRVGGKRPVCPNAKKLQDMLDSTSTT